MKRYLCTLLALCITGRAANFPDTSTDGQVIVNSNNVSAGSSSLRWSFTNTRLTVGPTGTGSRVDVEGATPAWRLYAGGNPATSYSRLEGFWDSGAQTYYLREITSGSNAIPFVVGINSGATLTFNTDGSALHSGSLGLSGTTNRLTIASNTLLLDGVPVASSTTTNTYNNIVVTNSITVSNLFVQNGSHNTMIITNSLTLQSVKTNVLATTATGLVTNVNYGTGLTWTPSTLTLSASGGETTSTNVVTLVLAGTNAPQLDFSLVTYGGVFKLTATNNVYFGTPANVSNTAFKRAWLFVQQPSTGTCLVTFTNGWFAFPEGAAPVNDTNNGSVTVYEFVTDVFTNGLVHGSMTPLSKLIP